MLTGVFVRLRSRLLLFAAALLLPVFLVISYNLFEERRLISEYAEVNLNNLARLAAKQQHDIIQSSRYLLSTLAQVPILKPPLQSDQCGSYLKEFVTNESPYLNIGVIDTSGLVQCSSVAISETMYLGDRKYFKDAIESKGFSVGEYQVGRITGKSGLNSAYPILNDRGEVEFVVFASTGMQWLKKLNETFGQKSTISFLMVDSQGMVIDRFPQMPDIAGTSIANTVLLQEASRVEDGELFSSIGLDGVERLYVRLTLEKLPNSTDQLFIGQSKEILYAELHKKTIISVLMITFLLLLLIALFWIGSEYFVLAPVRALESAARRLKDGDLSVRTELRHDHSELGQLASTFDLMSEKLQQNILELKKTNKTLKALSAGNQTLIRAKNETDLLQAMAKVPIDNDIGLTAIVCYFKDADNLTDLQEMSQSGISIGGKVFLEKYLAHIHEFAKKSFEEKTPVVVNDFRIEFSNADWVQDIIEKNIISSVLLPLKVSAGLLGFFFIGSKSPNVFRFRELELLSEMADDLAYGIEMLRTKKAHEDAEMDIEYLAFHDKATGLPNLLSLIQIVEYQIKKCLESGNSMAILNLKIDHHQEISAYLGYEHANRMVQAICARLKASSEKIHTISRIAQDELAILLLDADEYGALRFSNRLQNVLREPFDENGFQFNLGCTIGIAICPTHGQKAELLIRSATLGAMQTKESMESYGLYVQEPREAVERRLALAISLNRAIHNEELMLYWQPKQNIKTRQLVGAEALLRWRHEQYGMVSPTEFVKLAERTGLIHQLSAWVLNASIKQGAKWKEKGFAVPIAINLSTYDLRRDGLPDYVRSLLENRGVVPQMLQLEITETALMENRDRGIKTLTELREMGVKIFIDDFGTGYSSLSYLQKLPIDAVKIDQSFIMEMIGNPATFRIVKLMIELAHSLNIKVVAEGVENQQVLDQLALLGCDEIQGYFISEPLPSVEFERWISLS